MTTNSKEMIWILRVKQPGRESECIRIIEVKSNTSFLKLHEVIQNAVNFDNDHLFEFYIGRHPGQSAYLIGREHNRDTFNPDKTYKNIRISSVWPLPTGMKLFYRFDFGDNWIFQITRTRHKDKAVEPGIVYPRIIESKGKDPEQYPDWEYE